jgi:hypothetical protein
MVRCDSDAHRGFSLTCWSKLRVVESAVQAASVAHTSCLLFPNMARPKNEDTFGTFVPANRLRFQPFVLTTGVLALADYFRNTFRISTRITAVLFPDRRWTVASGMCAFRR